MKTSPLKNLCQEENPPKEDSKRYNTYCEREHNERVIRLAENLIRRGYCEIAFPFLEYNKNNIMGEIDLLTESEEGETWFEIKHKFSRSKLRKAVSQFKRYTEAFPDFSGRGYLVCCDGVTIELSNKEVLKQFE